LLVEQGEISYDIVATTVRGFTEERIEIVRQRVMTNEHIEGIIEDNALYLDTPLSPREKNRLFGDRASVIVEQMDDGTMSFIVAFDGEDPVQATKVTARLIDLFQEENVRSRTESAMNTAEFLENEAARLSVQIADFEDRIAAYKEENSGRLPEQERLNMQTLDRLQRELEAAEREIRDLAQRKAVAEADLAQVRADLAQARAGVVGAEPLPGSPERLRFLKAKYMRMLSTYSSEHPDVREIQREIELLDPNGSLVNVPFITEQIRQRTIELAELRRRYSESHPDVIATRRALDRLQQELDEAKSESPDNMQVTDPESQRLLAIIRGLDREAAAQRARRGELRERIAVLESRLMDTPQVQREYLSLTRGYEQLQKKYNDIKLKQTQMELAVSVETGQRAGRFTVITQAQTPDSPFNPNRPALIFLGILVGAGSGLLVSAMLDAVDKTLRDEIDVREMWGAPPMVSIPVIRNQADVRRKYIRISVYTVVIFIMVAGASISVFNSA
jgi:capsular polysaccharide biosynthesis protein